MKIVFLVILAGIFVVENEAWGPRIRLPRIRLPRIRLPRVRLPRIHLPRVRLPRIRLPRVRLPRIRVPSIRIPVLKPIYTIYDKASKEFANLYSTVCAGDQLKSNCGPDLVTRVQNICNGQSCLQRNFKFGKRSISIDSSDLNAGRFNRMIV